MNELERALSAARPAGPSSDLDDRVRQTLRDADARALGRDRTRSRRALLLACCASAAVAATIGFFAGRGTVAMEGPTAPSPAAKSGIAATDPTKSEAAGKNSKVTTVPLSDERLAGLFMRSGAREGLLGSGPLTIEISTPANP